MELLTALLVSAALTALLYLGVPVTARLWNRRYKRTISQHLLCFGAALIFFFAFLTWRVMSLTAGAVEDLGTTILQAEEDLLSNLPPNPAADDTGLALIQRVLDEGARTLLKTLDAWMGGWTLKIKTWSILSACAVQVLAYGVVNFAAYKDLRPSH